jgi:hypothetical protein
MCVMCKARGVDRVATVANHATPHHGDYTAFWYGRLTSLCANCHDSDMQRIEGGGRARAQVDVDGWPIGQGGGRLELERKNKRADES